ncbi:glycogen synthase GlgA [Chitinimonas sp. BJYL2]|uniref:glycogen synthase GlgA n=1 Tax=Chitinimonas sp. BJYL2 TaxID=2976696 RepID=UPI0022B5B0C1|nr:glycogen synthase GlgA [Chitinimonas sp. BJYL2]
MSQSSLRVLHVAAECHPLLKTGGLADVVGALPHAQRLLGADARILLPGFPAIRQGLPDAQSVAALLPRFGSAGGKLLASTLPDGTPVYVIDVPEAFDRSGNPYADAAGQPYADNARRFAWLGWVAAQMAQGELGPWQPAIVHAHDWHAGLAPAYLAHTPIKGKRAAGSVFTIHNLAYQGVFPASEFAALGLPPASFHLEGLEFYGQISLIKAGLAYCDRITTVSPSYAREILHAEHGCGLDGLLRKREAVLSGILNGVDETQWDPAHDPCLPAHFDAAHPAGKARCKAALQESLGLTVDADALLFGVVSRLTEQKGLTLVLGGADKLLQQGGQLVVLGNGEPTLEAGFLALAAQYPGRVALCTGFDEVLSHRIFAGCEVVLIPSRFEPCGLTQMYGMRYGALPLVRRTGGLADTVVDCSIENLADETASGFVFERFEQADFDAAVRRAYTLHATPARWRAVRRHAMNLHFGWSGPAGRYLALYQYLATA